MVKKPAMTRRQFVRTSTSTVLAGATGAFLARPALAMLGTRPEPVPPIQDTRIKEIVQHALDVARGAGASYADVRLTYDKTSYYRLGELIEGEYLAAGVRALVNGFWGFASSPVWSRTELERLSREAVRQATVTGLGKTREIVWPDLPPVVDGHWETPVEIDAFTVHPQEILDYLNGLAVAMDLEMGKMIKMGFTEYTSRTKGHGVEAWFGIQEKAFGSTEGTYLTQRLHRTEGACICWASPLGQYPTVAGNVGTLLDLTSAGWEVFQYDALLDRIRASLQESARASQMPVKPVEVGKYHVIFDTGPVAALLSRTIGQATELDRVLGYEANATGTSYLNAPQEILDAFTLGAPTLTVTANRSEPGGAATVRWDDDGVQPDDMTLIQNGVVTDFQTSREGAGWIRDTYARMNRPFRSHGCMSAENALRVPLIRTANLVMQPAPEDRTLQDLEAEVGDGIVIDNMFTDIDFQLTSGTGYKLSAFELKGGKRVARINGAELLFRASELWKNTTAIGGSATAVRHGIGIKRKGMGPMKGEPGQPGFHSVTAVPIAVRDVSIIDSERR